VKSYKDSTEVSKAVLSALQQMSSTLTAQKQALDKASAALKAQNDRAEQISKRRPQIQFSLTCGYDGPSTQSHIIVMPTTLNWNSLKSGTSKMELHIPPGADSFPCHADVTNSGEATLQGTSFVWRVPPMYNIRTDTIIIGLSPVVELS
jgi:hypothetical protein